MTALALPLSLARTGAALASCVMAHSEVAAAKELDLRVIGIVIIKLIVI